MAQLPPFLPVSALSVELDAFVAIAAASQAGFADARATFELTLPVSFGPAPLVLAGVEPLVDALERYKLKADELGWLEPLGFLDDTSLERLRSMRMSLDVDAAPEGSVVFPGEPLAVVEGPFWQAQLVGALLAGALATPTVVASRAARLCLAAGGAEVIDAFSASCHRLGGVALAARAAFIGGFAATTSAVAARRYRIPIRATLPMNLVLGAPDAERLFVATAKTLRDRPVFRLDPRSPLTSLSGIVAALKKRGAGRFSRGDIGIEIAGGDAAELPRQVLEAFRTAAMPEP